MKHTLPMPGNPREILENDVLIPEKREAALACIRAYKEGKDTGDIREVDPEKDITPLEVEHLFTAQVKKPGYPVIQGGYFDGMNFYEGFIHWVNGIESAVIGVFAEDGTYIRESEDLPIFHCNTINPIGDGKLLIAACEHGQNDRTYKIVDKTTLTVTGGGTLPFPFMSADFCAETGLYACTGIGYGEDCRILDSDMKEIMNRRIVFQKGTAPQNFYPTEDWLYSPRYIFHEATGEFTNFVYVYSWDLGLRRIFSFRTEASKQEVQALTVMNGTIYFMCGDHEQGSLSTYKCKLPEI